MAGADTDLVAQLFDARYQRLVVEGGAIGLVAHAPNDGGYGVALIVIWPLLTGCVRALSSGHGCIAQ